MTLRRLNVNSDGEEVTSEGKTFHMQLCISNREGHVYTGIQPATIFGCVTCSGEVLASEKVLWWPLV